MFSVFSCSSWTPVWLLWRNVYLDLPPIFWLGILICLFVCFNVELHELLHILKINPLLVTSFADIFFLSVGSFHWGRTLSPRGQFLSFIRLHFFIWVFIFITLGSGLEKIFLRFMSESVLPMFFSNVFIVPSLTFRSLIYLGFIFMCGVRDRSDFILLHATVQFSQHHLLKRLSFLHCIFLSLLS